MYMNKQKISKIIAKKNKFIPENLNDIVCFIIGTFNNGGYFCATTIYAIKKGFC